MAPFFLFAIIDENALSTEDEREEKEDLLYVHPSSDGNLLRSRGAFVTLWDVTKKEEPCQDALNSRILISENVANLSTFHDRREQLFFVLGYSHREAKGAFASCLLRALSDILTFISADLRKSLQQASFASDLDGMVIYALHSEWNEPALGDPVLCIRCPADHGLEEIMENVVTEFEAGEELDQCLIDQGECFILGTCIFLNDTLVVNHLHPTLFMSVSRLMKFHRIGFRAGRNGGSNVIEVFPYYDGSPVRRGARFFLVWVANGLLSVCACVKLFPYRTENVGRMLEVVLQNICTTSQGQQLQSAVNLYCRKNRRLSGLTSSEAILPGGEVIEIRPGSLYPIKELSSLVHRGLSMNNAPEHPRSSIIYSIRIWLAEYTLRIESFVDSHVTNSVLPPSLLGDFLSTVSYMRITIESESLGEISVLLEYPSPALLKRYWITGRLLQNSQRLVFICYPEGSENAALLESL